MAIGVTCRFSVTVCSVDVRGRRMRARPFIEGTSTSPSSNLCPLPGRNGRKDPSGDKSTSGLPGMTKPVAVLVTVDRSLPHSGSPSGSRPVVTWPDGDCRR